MKRIGLYVGCAAAVSFLGLASVQAQETIKIGSVTPNTGMMAPTGDDLARSLELAIDRINSEGGVLGKKLELVRGAAVNPQEGIAAVDQLVGRDRVDMLIGTISTAISNSASEAAMNYGKLYWEVGALSNDLTARGLPNYIRSGPKGSDFAKRSVQGVVELIAAKIGKEPKDLKVWVEHEDSAYGSTIAADQVKALKKAGIQVFEGSHKASSIDLSDSVLRAKIAAPDVWMHTNYVADLNLLLKTAREQNFKPAAIMSLGTGDTVETLNSVGAEGLEGMLVVSYPRPGTNERYTPGAAAFAEAFTKKYGSPPISPAGMGGYVGMRILAEAIKAAGSVEYEKVIKAAEGFDKPEGSYETGYGVKFDKNRQNTRAFPIIGQWQSGKVVVVYPPAAVPEGAKIVDLARK